MAVRMQMDCKDAFCGGDGAYCIIMFLIFVMAVCVPGVRLQTVSRRLFSLDVDGMNGAGGRPIYVRRLAKSVIFSYFCNCNGKMFMTMPVIYKRVGMALGLLLCTVLALAADYGKYTKLINSVSKLPSESILRHGDNSLAEGRSDEAMVLYMVVCSRADGRLDDKGRASCALAHLKVGDIYYHRGDYTRALESYADGLRLYEAGAGGSLAALFYKNIGNVYAQFDDFGRAVSYYKSGLKVCREHPDADTERKILINLTGQCIAAGKPGEARRYLDASLKVKGGGDNVTRFMNGFNRSLIQSAYGVYDKAVPALRRLAAYAVDSGLPPLYECCAYQELYKAFDKMGRVDSTLHYLRKCEREAARHGIGHYFVDMLKDASAIYETAGMHGKAVEYKAKFLTVSDSVLNQREFEKVKNEQFQYEMEKAGNEIQDLRLKHEKSRQTIARQRAAMGLGLAALLVVTVFVAVLYRQNRKLNESYAGLYALNRDFINRQESMDKRHADDLDRISRAEAEAAELRARLCVPVDGGEAEADSRYKSSNLDHAQQQALAREIVRVMDGGEEFCRDDFSLDRLAALVGSNSKYVSQAINGTYNKNFSNFVNEYRIRMACKRLADDREWGNITVKAVGESVGYKSHATFVNIFKKMTGLTPSLYQKMARSNSDL